MAAKNFNPKHGQFWWVIVTRPRGSLFTVALVQNIGDELALMVIGKDEVYHLDDYRIKFVRRIPIPKIFLKKMSDDQSM